MINYRHLNPFVRASGSTACGRQPMLPPQAVLFFVYVRGGRQGGAMEVIHLCAAAHEADYIRRLADYVRQSPYGRSWRVSGFSSADSLTQYLTGGYPADLLLVPPDMAAPARQLRPGVPAALLVRHAAEAKDEGAAVLQYQPMPQLMRQLAAIMAEQGLHAGMRTADEGGAGGPSVLAVYSPSGGCGVTTAALGLAHQ